MGIRVSTPEILPALKERFPPGWVETSDERVDLLYSVSALRTASGKPRRVGVLYSGFEGEFRHADFSEICDAFESECHKDVALNAPGFVFVHAGAVVMKHGAVLFPGRSLSGKTTLVRACLDAGARLLSDEYAVLDGDGHVHPFPRPLGIRGSAGYRQTRVPAAQLGAAVAEGPSRVSAIVSCRFEGGRRFRPRPLSHGNAILELLRHSVPARTRPEETLAALGAVVGGARAWRGVRGEAKEVVEFLGGVEASRSATRAAEDQIR